MTNSRSLSTIRSRAGLGIATIGVAALIAGCGSSSPSSTITIGNENSSDNALAKAGQTVTVNYVGVLFKGGKVFDASWKRNEPFSFPLGKGQVIPGWDQGIPGMKVGGRRELIIPAALAYGAKGSPPTIPPNAPLVFVVDLLGT